MTCHRHPLSLHPSPPLLLLPKEARKYELLLFRRPPRPPPLDPEHESILNEFQQYNNDYMTLPPAPSPSAISTINCPNTPHYLFFSEIPMLAQPEVNPNTVNPNTTNFYVQTVAGWHKVEPYRIRSFIINPHEVNGPYTDMWMQLEEGGVMMPAHLPNIGDLQALSRKNGLDLRNWVAMQPKSSNLIAPEDIVHMVDIAPVLPTCRTNNLLRSELSMFMDSYTNAVFLGHVNDAYSSMAIIVNPISMQMEDIAEPAVNAEIVIGQSLVEKMLKDSSQKK